MSQDERLDFEWEYGKVCRGAERLQALAMENVSRSIDRLAAAVEEYVKLRRPRPKSQWDHADNF